MKNVSGATLLLAAGIVLYASDPLTAAPTGLDTASQLQTTGELAATAPGALAFVRLQNGLQLRVGGVAKNVLFYGPDLVRVNANLGQANTRCVNILL